MARANVNLQAVRAAKQCVETLSQELKTMEREMRRISFQAASSWNDEKGARFRFIVEGCCADIKNLAKELDECCDRLEKIIQTLEEYESARLDGATDGVASPRSAPAPADASFGVTGVAAGVGDEASADADGVAQVGEGHGGDGTASAEDAGGTDADNWWEAEARRARENAARWREIASSQTAPVDGTDSVADGVASGGESSGGDGTASADDAGGTDADNRRNDADFMADVEQTRERHIDTSIEACMTQTNPQYRSVQSARERLRDMERRLNNRDIEFRMMLAITSSRNQDSRISREDWSSYRQYSRATRVFHELHTSYGMNCQRCVLANELRRRGYDVIAKARPMDDHGNPSPVDIVSANWRHLFKNQQWQDCSDEDSTTAWSNLENKLARYDDGSRFVIYYQWKRSGRYHVINAEKRGGRIEFIDSQAGYSPSWDYLREHSGGHIEFSRIDDLEVDERFLREAVRINDDI